MIITCGQCQARFKVAPEQIKVTGSKVRCSNCRSVFTVFRPEGPEDGPDARGLKERAGAFPQEAPEGAAPFPDEEEAESPQARRERLRRLYAGPAEPGPDPSEGDEGWAEANLDETTGRPPLRRRPGSAAPPPLPPAGPGPDEETEPPPGAEDWAEGWGEPDGWAAEEEPAATGHRDEYGLAADPRLRPQAPPLLEDDYRPSASSHPQEGTEVRAAVTRIRGRRGSLYLGLAIFCAALAIGLYYLSSRPEPLALSGDGYSPGTSAVSGGPGPAQPSGGTDPRGVERITFTPKDNLKHFYRKNTREGELLIITGRVRNSYPAPRSFIRLRGLLLDQGGNTLADRFVYAGNLISEEELLTLPKEEIMARLNIKGGQNNQNMNIPPGKEVPFMVVFDKVPLNKDEYRIIPVGSSPVE